MPSCFFPSILRRLFATVFDVVLTNSGSGDPRWSCRWIFTSDLASKRLAGHAAQPGVKKAISRQTQLTETGAGDVAERLAGQEGWGGCRIAR
jgi:hypothetical protein